MGIGTIKNDYLSPADAHNPSQDLEYRHARRVDWVIKEPITLSRKFFGQRPKTVSEVDPDQWQEIKEAYLKKYPGLEDAFKKLENSVNGPTVEDDLGVPKEILELLSICRQTRNLILYGPPGTGKTYWVRRFAEHFVRPQLNELASAEEKRIKILQNLKWYEAIALTMALADERRSL